MADHWRTSRKNAVKPEEITQDLVREWFLYDPETGVISWAKRPSAKSRRRVGDPAGMVAKGYIYIGLLGGRYFAHRIIWMYVHGRWPSDQIDHIDGDKMNNSLVNLREVSHLENCSNRVSRGFSFNKKDRRYCSSILHDGKIHWLGYFDTAAEARQKYLSEHARIKGEFSFTRRPTFVGDAA
jgi:hypothetical protein